MTTPTIAVLATLDTKHAEAAFLAAELARHGCVPLVVDVGVRAPEAVAHCDVTGDAVAEAAGTTRAQLLDDGERDAAMHAMGAGAGSILRRHADDGQLDGVVAVGGNQGAAIAADALRQLPFGVPKLIVCTVASGDVRPYVGDADIMMAFSVGDLLGGPNRVTEGVLRRAAGAVVGMAEANRTPALQHEGPAIAITAFGNTHRGVTAAIDRLAASGLHPVPFHASGASGSAMERLIDEGVLAGVLDYTTHELLAELHPEDIYTPVRPRLVAAGRAGVPQVVVPGGLEYFCFGPYDTVPTALRDRAIHHHNPYNMNVRAGHDELAEVGRLMAKRLNDARGPAAVLIPLQGWSEVGGPGGVLHDPDANAGFVDALRADLAPHVELRVEDTTINDPAFARLAADMLVDLLDGARTPAATTPTPTPTPRSIR